MSQRRRYPTYPSEAQTQQAVPNVPSVQQQPQPPIQQPGYQVEMLDTAPEEKQPPLIGADIHQDVASTTQKYDVAPVYIQQQSELERNQAGQYLQAADPVLTGQSTSAFAMSEILQFSHSVLPSTNGDLAVFPTGLLIQPYKQEQLQAIDFNNSMRVNPQRCQSCKAFVNCYSEFTEFGRHICPLCGVETQLDFEYERIMRIEGEKAKRPELQAEAYDIIVPEIYRVRRGDTFETLSFLFDISPQAIQSGLVREAAKYVEKQLRVHMERQERTMVCIVLVNTQVHYCVFRNALNFEIYTVPDSDQPYVPAPRDVIVSLKSRGEPVLSILQHLEEIAKSIPAPVVSKRGLTHSSADVAFYAAIEQVYKCMQNVGGKITYFLSQAPSHGEGALIEHYEKRKASGKSSQNSDATPLKEALASGSEQYTDLGVKMSLSQVSVDGVVATFTEFCDLATLNELSRTTAGRIHHIPEFTPERDGPLLDAYINEACNPDDVLEACIRLRCSKQVDVKYFYGPGQNGNQNLVNLAHVDRDLTVGAELTIQEGMKVGSYVYFQLSFLYTTKMNVRYARVVTRRVPVGGQLHYYQSINIKPAIVLAAKKLVFALRKNADIQSNQTHLISMEGAQALHAASLSSSAAFESTTNALNGQLFAYLQQYMKLTHFTNLQQFPSKIQEFVCFAFALTKLPFARPVGSKVYVDERVAAMSRIEHTSVDRAIQLIYPLCLNIQGERVRLSTDAIVQENIYVIGGPYQIFVYLGAQLDLQILSQLTIGRKTNLQSFVDLNLEAENQYAQSLKRCITQIQQTIGYPLPYVCVSGQSRLTGPVYNCFIEARVDGLGFTDFLRLLQANLANK